MNGKKPVDLAHDLFFPMILLGAIGGMTWAVRGSSGYGASHGCIFAGVMLGAAWWFMARDPSGTQSRRYTSGWIILAMTVGFGIAGNRGWAQWVHFLRGQLSVDHANNEFVPISPIYGYAWWFIAGVPWAGMGACMLAWCGSGQRTTPLLWLVRLACGIGLAYVLSVPIYNALPEVFLPLYDSLKDKYDIATRDHYNSLWRLIRDGRESMIQLGLYLGFLGFEIARRDWKNVTLIATVGVLNGLGWALLQCWVWAERFWPGAQFNFWRCFESSAGISIGIAFGVAYFLVNRPMAEDEIAERSAPARQLASTPFWVAAFIVTSAILGFISFEVMFAQYAIALAVVAAVFAVAYYMKALRERSPQSSALWSVSGPYLERWGAYTGLIFGLGLSIKNGFKGWANIYLGDENYWHDVGMNVVGPLMVLGLVAVSARILMRPRPASPHNDAFPRAYGLIWLVLIVQNILAQLVTGKHDNWSEVAFALYYVLLFLMSAVIVHHYHRMKSPPAVQH